MYIRRVVIGVDHSGKSVFASDDELNGLVMDVLPGEEYLDNWGVDTTPTLPNAGDKPLAPADPPAVGAFRFAFTVIPQRDTPPVGGVDPQELLARVNAALPGMMEPLKPDGFHATDTIDKEVIIKGDVTLVVLDDAQEKVLRAGDTVVQDGTRHVWRVDGPEPCRMAVHARRPSHWRVPEVAELSLNTIPDPDGAGCALAIQGPLGLANPQADAVDLVDSLEDTVADVVAQPTGAAPDPLSAGFTSADVLEVRHFGNLTWANCREVVGPQRTAASRSGLVGSGAIRKPARNGPVQVPGGIT